MNTHVTTANTGIEAPGLTSSLSIADEVVAKLTA
jgi:hypothetical protein